MIELRPARPDEYEDIGRLCDRAFAAGLPPDQWPGAQDGRTFEHNILRAVIGGHPEFEPDHLRVAESGGRLAAMTLFVPCRLRVGRTPVAANAVALVAVEPELQGQGHGTAVMEDALAAMRRAGHLLSYLYGHPGYYDRFGYSPAFPKAGATADVAKVRPDPAPGYRVVPVEPAHFSRLAALWNENTAALTLSDVRDDSPWRWLPRSVSADYRVLLDAQDAVAGYYQAGATPGSFEVFDAAIRDERAGAALLAHVRGLAEEWGADSVELRLSHGHPLARVAWRYGARLHTRYSPARFARVLDLPALFECLRDEFNHRLTHSEFHGHTGMIAVRCEDGAATLALRGGLVQGVMARAVVGAPLLDLPLARLTPLITGHCALGDVPGVAVDAGARRLADVLFPPGCPRPPKWPFFQL